MNIEKLARHLKEFTLDEIEMIAECDCKTELELLLNEDKLKQAEHLYVYEQQPLDVIGTKLDLSRRTLFYWKKEYEWDRKRFEKCREQKLFNRELLNFAQKIMDKISNDIDNNQQPQM